jgi:hypothetical protein
MRLRIDHPLIMAMMIALPGMAQGHPLVSMLWKCIAMSDHHSYLPVPDQSNQHEAQKPGIPIAPGVYHIARLGSVQMIPDHATTFRSLRSYLTSEERSLLELDGVQAATQLSRVECFLIRIEPSESTFPNNGSEGPYLPKPVDLGMITLCALEQDGTKRFLEVGRANCFTRQKGMPKTIERSITIETIAPWVYRITTCELAAGEYAIVLTSDDKLGPVRYTVFDFGIQ